jgi:hypothetical protein
LIVLSRKFIIITIFFAVHIHNIIRTAILLFIYLSIIIKVEHANKNIEHNKKSPIKYLKFQNPFNNHTLVTEQIIVLYNFNEINK